MVGRGRATTFSFFVDSGLVEEALVLLSTKADTELVTSLYFFFGLNLHGRHGRDVKTKQCAADDGHRGDDIDVGNLITHDDRWA